MSDLCAWKATWGIYFVLSILVYRLGFHPLARYPGPLLAACTDWYTVFWHVSGNRHLELHRQHGKHGKYVRFGPNSLSINSAIASRDLHDVNANTSKSTMYTASKRFFGAEMSMAIIDVKVHAFRRRVNMSVMTPDAVRTLGNKVKSHVDFFLENIEKSIVGNMKSKRETVWSCGLDMASLVGYLIADIMGDVTFSQTWNVQRDAKNRHFVHDVPKGVSGMILCGHMLSLFTFDLHRLLFRDLINGVSKLNALSLSFSSKRLEEHNEGISRDDFWEALMAARDPKTGKGFTREELVSEACLFTAAGTDTLITAVSSTLFYLTHAPHALERLTREIRDAFPTAIGQFAGSELQQATYLTACIDEALRLCPPIPSILPRQVGPGGMVVDGEFFPQSVVLGIPHYSLHRNEEYFEEPLAYKPERWLVDEQELERDATQGIRDSYPGLKPGVGQAMAYTPFGVGRYSCIGKQMAYQEVSYILARIIWTFDLRLEPGNHLGEGTDAGSEGRTRENEYQVYDRHVCEQHGPILQFKLREAVNMVP
ncbi:cytochrome P450 [Annulohypoxylon bovei var. microspora]|nr:cytochrome P450 [Annulohypoxylon bovei var. microspora]